MKVFDIASAQPWLMRAETLDTILDICSRDNVITAEVMTKMDVRRETLAARVGRRADNTRYTTRRENGVTIIDISGPIVRYADMFTEISGGTSTQHLATDLQAAIDDPGTRYIVLNIDSPGGEATGIHELANMIYAARGKKPIIAYAAGWMASAAYWIGSAADEIVVDATSMIGSIGTVLAVADPTEAKKRRIEIISTQSPKKRPDASTEAGRSELQRWADELTDVFIDSVARNRGVSTDFVLSDFGQGGIRIGQDAVTHKMADRLGSLEALIAELPNRKFSARPHAAAATNSVEESMYTKELKLKLGLAETATDAEVDAKLAEMRGASTRLQSVESELKAEQEKRTKAEATAKVEAEAKEAALRAKVKTEAEAQVEAWQREGMITGNATAAVKTFYVALATGEKVTADGFAAVMAALPKFDTTRLSANLEPKPAVAPDVTLEDFKRQAIDAKAAQRIKAAVTLRQKENPKFATEDLRRELTGK